MKPGLAQQALAGLAVLFVIAVTLVGGVLLAFGENPEAIGMGATRTPTATPYRLATVPPATLTRTAVSPSLTQAPLPAATQAPTETLLPSSTPTSPPTSLPTTPPCEVQAGWVPYIVRAGETLFQIGLRYGLTVDALQRGSCLASTQLEAGQVIYVPLVDPPPPTSAPGPTNIPSTPHATPTSTGGAGVCSTPDAYFSRPHVGDVLSGVASFYGTATNPAFDFYKLELRQEGASQPSAFTTFVTSNEPVVNGLLGQLDTSAFPNGEYWVRLVVVDRTGNYPEPCTKLVVFRN